jgi:threonine synthase
VATVAALRRAVAEGRITAADEVVLVITGNGLKTLEALEDGVPLPAPIEPTFEAFESWQEARAA